MTVLLDENIPRKLKWRFIERDVEVVTVPERGWAGVKNGELLRRAEDEFDVLPRACFDFLFWAASGSAGLQIAPNLGP